MKSERPCPFTAEGMGSIPGQGTGAGSHMGVAKKKKKVAISVSDDR